MGKFLLCLMFSSNVFAASVQEASDLYNKRGEDPKNSEKAALMYRELAANESAPISKAIFKIKESQALFYLGTIQTTDSQKKEVHTKGMDAGKEAMDLIDTTNASNSDKATAHYFYAINLGKWGEANGVLSSLGKWPELRRQLDIIDSLDNSVEDYGALRTRARAYHKLPGSDKAQAEKLLAEAYTKTLNEQFGLSRSTITDLFYLDILAKNRNVEAFCPLFAALTDLSTRTDAELLEFNSARLPETKSDLKNFVENKSFEENIAKFAERNCN